MQRFDTDLPLSENKKYMGNIQIDLMPNYVLIF